MKKIVTIALTIVSLYIFVPNAYAAAAVQKTVTPSPAPSAASGDKLNDQINQLKEKIASRVAELNLVEKRGVIGIVAETSANQITITDIAGKNRIIDVDEITKFSSPGVKGSFGISDLTKGTKISVLGLYNKQSKRILARFIEVTASPTFLSGAVSTIDPKNFIVTVISADQKETKVDIQTTTKILTQEKETGLVKYGFSKVKVTDRIFVIGSPDKKDPMLFVATRFIVLPELPQDPKIIISQPEEGITDTITPSTGNGKKLTPIR